MRGNRGSLPVHHRCGVLLAGQQLVLGRQLGQYQLVVHCDREHQRDVERRRRGYGLRHRRGAGPDLRRRQRATGVEAANR